MKYLIFGTLTILLLFLSQTIQAQEWEELDPSDVANSESSIARDLLDVSIGYIEQKGLFESTKAPFPGNYYKGGYDNTTYERKNTSTVTYYRYNFLLTQDGGPATVNATTIVSYNPSNSNFKVTNYSYHIDYHGNEDQNEEDGGLPVKYALVDTRSLTGDGDLASVVNDTFNYILATHLEAGSLPDAKYTITYAYGAYSAEYDGKVNEEGEFIEEEVGEVEYDSEGTVDDEEYSGPSPPYKYYEVTLKVKSNLGKYYLIVMDINYTYQDGEFVLDKSGSWAGVELQQ